VPAPLNSAIPPYYSHARQNGATPEHAGALGRRRPEAGEDAGDDDNDTG
jgi:hypothetical protein